MNMPGFSAALALNQPRTMCQIAADRADPSGARSVVPQFCHCRAVGTLRLGPGGVAEWGPPYHYVCYGPDCWRPRFGFQPQ
jgi:hypothetical protein